MYQIVVRQKLEFNGRIEGETKNNASIKISGSQGETHCFRCADDAPMAAASHPVAGSMTCLHVCVYGTGAAPHCLQRPHERERKM